MLYLGNDLGKPKRVQGVLVSEKEILEVTGFLKKQAPSLYEETIQDYHPAGTGGARGGGDASDDTLFDEAKQLVVQSGKASASLLQRRLRVGYARAARLLDILEQEGVIGPPDGAKPRDVMIDPIALDRERAQARTPTRLDSRQARQVNEEMQREGQRSDWQSRYGQHIRKSPPSYGPPDYRQSPYHQPPTPQPPTYPPKYPEQDKDEGQ